MQNTQKMQILDHVQGALEFGYQPIRGHMYLSMPSLVCLGPSIYSKRIMK
jgi:hypothetical protein